MYFHFIYYAYNVYIFFFYNFLFFISKSYRLYCSFSLSFAHVLVYVGGENWMQTFTLFMHSSIDSTILFYFFKDYSTSNNKMVTKKPVADRGPPQCVTDSKVNVANNHGSDQQSNHEKSPQKNGPSSPLRSNASVT